MAGTNPIATWLLTNFNTQTATAYKATIDGDNAVAQRSVANFAPSQQATPNMTVLVAAGHLYAPGGLTEVGAQASATITAPVSNPRIDRIVIDQLTGIISVVTGTEALSPTPPAIPIGKLPVAQVLLQTSSASITNSMMTDERDLSHLGQRHRTLVAFTSSGSWTVPPGVYEITVLLFAAGGGGGGGGSGTGTSSATPALGGAGTKGGDGALVRAVIPVTPGTVLTVTIGSAGSAGSGGASQGNSGSGQAAGGNGGAGTATSLANGSTWTITAQAGAAGLGWSGLGDSPGASGTGTTSGTLPIGTVVATFTGLGSPGGAPGNGGNSGSAGGAGRAGIGAAIMIEY